MPDPDLPPELLKKLAKLDLSKQEDLDTLFALEAELGDVIGFQTPGGPPPELLGPDEDPPPAFTAAADHTVDLPAFIDVVGTEAHQTYGSQSLLFPACLIGSFEKTRWILKQGVDPNQADPEGHTPFLYACLPGQQAHPKLLRLLLKHGADPHVESRHGETPLRVLVREGNYEATELLLGEDEDHPDFPLIHQAAAGNDVDRVRSLLSAATLEQRNYWQRTPWLTALHHSATEAAEFLESQGADTAAVGHAGDTALHLAAEADAVRSVSYLLSQGAEVDIRAPHGNTPLHNAVEADSLGTARRLLRAGADVQALTAEGDRPMAFADSTAMLKLLCIHGADPNRPDSRGLRPLEHFAECGDLDALSWLLANGADLTLLSEDGRSHIKALLTT